MQRSKTMLGHEELLLGTRYNPESGLVGGKFALATLPVILIVLWNCQLQDGRGHSNEREKEDPTFVAFFGRATEKNTKAVINGRTGVGNESRAYSSKISKFPFSHWANIVEPSGDLYRSRIKLRFQKRTRNVRAYHFATLGKFPTLLGSGVMCSVVFTGGGVDKLYCGGCQTLCSSMKTAVSEYRVLKSSLGTWRRPRSVQNSECVRARMRRRRSKILGKQRSETDKI